jgi:hypothetical protein
MYVLAILHRETGVACSRNSSPSSRGRPSLSLLDHGFKRVSRGRNVVYKSIAVSPSTLTAFSASSRSARDPQPCLGLHPRTPLLVTLVAIFRPCLVWPFCAPAVEISSPNMLVQSWASTFLLIWKSNPSSG